MSKHYVISEMNRCTGCTACQAACTSEAISMIEDPDQRYGYVAVIDEDKCTGCGKCGRICPVLSPSENQNSSSPNTFVLSADADTLRESASGGAFSLLARYILRNGGAVVGAAYRHDFRVSHIMIQTEEELGLLRRSKYVQSDMGTIIRTVQQELPARKVLFVGTPCQVAGVKACCRDSSNLYTVDLYCDHCPSNHLFQQYLTQSIGIEQIDQYQFRTKQYGWTPDTITIQYKDQQSRILRGSEDDYLLCFHSRLSMREVCEHCSFSSFPRQGDLSIGDFWWIEESHPEYYNPMGTSAVLVNNQHGQELFDRINMSQVSCHQVALSDMKKNRPADVPAHPFRNRFYDLLNIRSFHDAAVYSYHNRFDVVLWGNWSEKNYGSELTYYALYLILSRMGKLTLMVERPQNADWAPNCSPALFKKIPYPSYSLWVPKAKEEMGKLNEMADTFMVGSDQIWHHDLYDCFGKVCYLEFAHSEKKKIAYSSSFGREYWNGSEHDIRLTSALLKRFHAISVREPSAVQLCRDLFHVKAEWVLDPVFLLKKEDLEKLAKVSSSSGTNYIGVYVLDRFGDFEQSLTKIESALGCSSRIILDAFVEQRKDYIHSICKDASLEDWIANLANAKYVITDSFHGMCLSIIFHKPFAAISNESRGATRFLELLRFLHLENRLITEVIHPEEIIRILNTPIDYSKVDTLINTKRISSLQWLQNALNDTSDNSKYTESDLLYDELIDTRNSLYRYASELQKIDDWHTGRLDYHDKIENWHTERLDYHDKIEQWHTDRLDGLEQSQQSNFSQIESLTAQLKEIKSLLNELPEARVINYMRSKKSNHRSPQK